jgi:hypothetical protein
MISDMQKCNSQNALGGQRCNRRAGHAGLCRCKSERCSGGTLTYSEWQSHDGKFVSHVGYRTIYAKNARK